MSNLSEMPTERFYAIITLSSVSIPGDERSRTHPGHGYPAHTQHYPVIQHFTDEEEWRKAIQALIVPPSGFRKEFRAFVVEPVAPSVEVNLNIT